MRTWPALEVEPAQAGRGRAGPTSCRLRSSTTAIAAIDESAADLWRVFFSNNAERDRAAANLTRQFPDLSLRPLDVPDEDWVARSQADLRAVRVGNIIVAPPWDIPHTGKLKLDHSPEFGATRPRGGRS